MGAFTLQSPLGSLGEKLGCRYLKDKGYRIIETNYCNASGRRLGEIDIIAKQGSLFVFIEVKARTVVQKEKPLPEEAITRDKLRKLERVAAHYLREQRQENAPYRFDALSILYDVALKKASIRHLESIFL